MSSFTIYPGQTVALVGESGCGKSVTALSILRLIPSPPGKVLGGQVDVRGCATCSTLSEREMRARPRQGHRDDLPGADDQSLNPVYTIGDQIVEAVTLHQHVSTRQAYEIAEEALRDVGIADPRRRLARVSAPDVRRHAAARDDRDGPVLPAEAADRRRADDRAGRDDPGADPRTAAQAPARARHGDPADHARPRRRRGERRRRRT